MELVMEKYKQSEAGLIPEDWQLILLGDLLCQSPTYGLNAASIPFNFTHPTYLRITDISEDGNFIQSNKTSVNHPLAIKYFLNVGDIVFARTGASVGKSYLYNQNDGPLVFAGFLIRCKPNQELINPAFLKYVVQSRYYWNWVLSNSMRSGQPGINSNQLRELSIPLPTLSEQTAIATALNDMDALISSLEKLIEKKRMIKQGAMQELLKPKERWAVKRLGEIGDIITGGTPPTSIKEFWNGTIPWITPTDISSNRNIFNSEREISEAGLNSLRELPANTLLVTCIASIGKNSILRRRGACNQQINAVIPNDENNVDFLYYLIECNKNYILGKAGITATLLISKKDFSEITFSLPKSKAEQIKIATILSDLDTEISSLKTKLEKSKMIKHGIMQTLLTGKIRLI